QRECGCFHQADRSDRCGCRTGGRVGDEAGYGRREGHGVGAPGQHGAPPRSECGYPPLRGSKADREPHSQRTSPPRRPLLWVQGLAQSLLAPGHCSSTAVPCGVPCSERRSGTMSVTASVVIIERRGHVGLAIMNRPEKHNAMNAQLTREMVQALL